MNNAKIQIGEAIHKISPLIYGQFIEHLGRCINGGIYDEGSPLSDENGFRLDVLDKVKQLNPSMLRWPGGTFSKIYHWQSGIGAKSERPKMRNLIWGGVEDNHFGTDEFILYCRKIGAEPFLCVNMATGTAEEAAAWVEYCNGTSDNFYANLRRKNGFEQPFHVKYWGLGNEEWAVPDIGMLSDAEAYSKEAWQFAKYMKLTDKTIKLVLVGDIVNHEWNRKVTEALSPVCDYLSVHFYAGANDGDYASCFSQLDFIEENIIKIKQQLSLLPDREENFNQWYRFPPRQDKIMIALDEWNISPPASKLMNNSDEAGSSADPDDSYGLHVTYRWSEALWTASCMNMLLRHADRIGMAQLAQMVNVLAPIVTDENTSALQTIFYPLMLYRRYCGESFVSSSCECECLYSSKAKALDVSVTEKGNTFTLAAVNRHPSESVAAAITSNKDIRFEKAITADCSNLYDISSIDNPDAVKLQSTKITDASVYEFPPHSITILQGK